MSLVHGHRSEGVCRTLTAKLARFVAHRLAARLEHKARRYEARLSRKGRSV
jgi:hypothetical protein